MSDIQILPCTGQHRNDKSYYEVCPVCISVNKKELILKEHAMEVLKRVLRDVGVSDRDRDIVLFQFDIRL